jgi:hypothetical protein
VHEFTLLLDRSLYYTDQPIPSQGDSGLNQSCLAAATIKQVASMTVYSYTYKIIKQPSTGVTDIPGGIT